MYGRLHIAPFEDWNEDKDRLIEAVAAYRIEHFGCNHCTGATAVQKMLAAGLPAFRGSAQHGSKTDLFLGNGAHCRQAQPFVQALVQQYPWLQPAVTAQ